MHFLAYWSSFYDYFVGFQPDENCEYPVGDMVLSKNQMQEAFGEFEISDRSGINDANFRWKENKLPYILDESIKSPNDKIVKQAITRFNKEMTDCLEIVYV